MPADNKPTMAKIEDIPQENIAAIYLDKEKGQQLIFTRDQLINQLQRVCPEIEKSFDKTFSEEFKNLSSDLSEILPIQFVGYKNAHESSNNLLEEFGEY